jgi:hypothetical protein
MPYVKREYREKVDGEIKNLVTRLKQIKDADLDGCVNYSITRLIDELYGGGGYSVYNRAIGVLECIKHEFYRRLVSKYEDKKCLENGDVYRSNNV